MVTTWGIVMKRGGLWDEELKMGGLWGKELEVVFSLMSDGELLEMSKKLDMMMAEATYQVPKFPLSCSGLQWVKSHVMFEFWLRRGKGIKIEMGEIVVCELGESPYFTQYQVVEAEEVNEVKTEEVVDGRVERNDGEGEWV